MITALPLAAPGGLSFSLIRVDVVCIWYHRVWKKTVALQDE